MIAASKPRLPAFLRSAAELIDLKFLGKFLLIFVPLYYFNLLMWGLIDPNNYYSPFVDRYLDYIAVITSTILHASAFFVGLFQVNTVVSGNVITLASGSNLIMEAACVGLNIMSFWIAYVFAGSAGRKEKLKWCAAGLLAIWLINCLRVSLLLFSVEYKWDIGRYVNAHDMFNYAAYIVILLMILWVNNSKKDNESVEPAT